MNMQVIHVDTEKGKPGEPFGQSQSLGALM